MSLLHRIKDAIETAGSCAKPVIVGFSIVALSAHYASARTWRVMRDGSGDLPTIQAGIDSASNGDTVLVHSGTYTENLTITKSLTLVSADGPEVTIIDAGYRGRVVTIPRSGATGPLIVGFTLCKGQSSTDGGGVWIGQSGTTLRENYIRDNRAGGFDIGRGGGIYVDEETDSCLIESNRIQDNYAGSSAGGIFAIGSTVKQNLISGNSGRVNGGGAVLIGSVFTENLIIDNFSNYFAAGVHVQSFGQLINNTIVRNRIANQERAPAGVRAEWFTLVRNNIVAYNTGGTFTKRGVGIQCVGDRLITISCNDVWGNDIDDILCDASFVRPDNFSLDPLFCDEGSWNFHISDTSPCAPEGSCGLVGAMPSRCHRVPVWQVPWTHIKTLYR